MDTRELAAHIADTDDIDQAVSTALAATTTDRSAVELFDAIGDEHEARLQHGDAYDSGPLARLRAAERALKRWF